MTNKPSPGRRIKAFTLDFALIAAYILVLTALGLAWAFAQPEPAAADPILGDLIAFFTLVLPVILYFSVTESGPHQATWGKRRLGLRVAALAGGRLRFRAALLRNAARFAPWQLAHTALFHVPGWPLNVAQPPAWAIVLFGFVWVLVLWYSFSLIFSKSGRTPYDRLSGAEVILQGSQNGA